VVMAERVRVVTESSLDSANGVTTSVRRVLEHLRLRGFEAVAVCPGPAPAQVAGYRVVGVPAVSYRQFPVGLPSPQLRRTLEDFAPDVVHVASPFVLGAGALTLSRRLGLPSVAVYQTDVPGYARRHRLAPVASTAWRWIRTVHSRADLTLAPSTPTLDQLREHGVGPLARWGRGVDTVAFRPDRRDTPAVAALRRQLSPDGALLIGYVGRLAPEKRVERLAALAGLPGTRLVVVGDGPAAPCVRRALAGTGAHLLGRLDGDQLADAYAALDVFVHTGTDETFGQTVQEAMAAGLPVVAPAAGGPLDLIADGVTGLLYPGEDDGALRAAVSDLATDPRLRARLGGAARAEVLPRSWTLLGDQLVGLYRQVIAARTDPALRSATRSAA
jgi:phosphatidylinositol alpha 1,6-mannosyltransferase